MALLKSGSIPTYRHYKRANQAVVPIDGNVHYLGKFGTRESLDHYERLISEYQWRGRTASPNPSDD